MLALSLLHGDEQCGHAVGDETTGPCEPEIPRRRLAFFEPAAAQRQIDFGLEEFSGPGAELGAKYPGRKSLPLAKGQKDRFAPRALGRQDLLTRDPIRILFHAPQPRLERTGICAAPAVGMLLCA